MKRREGGGGEREMIMMMMLEIMMMRERGTLENGEVELHMYYNSSCGSSLTTPCNMDHLYHTPCLE